MTPAQIQVRRILDYQVDLAKQSFAERRDSIYVEHSARGNLQSGSTIRRVVRIMEEVAAILVSKIIEKVSVVARDTEAFSAIETTVDNFWIYFESEIRTTVNIASGRHPKDDGENDILKYSDGIFSKSRSLAHSKLQLYRFSYLKPNVLPDMQAKKVGVTDLVQVSERPVKKGGRPPAEFWDDMWAFIAGALYEGSLVPKSQADVERAMTNWIEANNSCAAVSTVRSRARRLWDRISLLDD